MAEQIDIGTHDTDMARIGRLAMILVLAAVAWGHWRGAMLWVYGWPDVGWTSHVRPGTAVTALFCVLSMMVGFGFQSDRRRRLLFLPVMVVVVCFASVPWFYAAYPGSGHLPMINRDLEQIWFQLPPDMMLPIGILGIPLLIALFWVALPSAAFVIAQRLRGRPWPWRTLALLLGAALATLPLSWLMVQVLRPASGAADIVQATAKGYPAFWAVALSGIAAALAARWNRDPPQMAGEADATFHAPNLRATGILLLAALALALWLAEVLLIYGWAGKAWTSHMRDGVALTGLICALAMLAGHRLRTAWWRRLAFLPLATIALYAGLVTWPEVYVPGSLTMPGLASLWLKGILGPHLLVSLACTGVAALVFYGLLRLLGQPRPLRTLGLLILAGISTLPLSWLTIQLLPALSGDTDLVHAVKMGYPAFWAVALTGGAMLLSSEAKYVADTLD